MADLLSLLSVKKNLKWLILPLNLYHNSQKLLDKQGLLPHIKLIEKTTTWIKRRLASSGETWCAPLQCSARRLRAGLAPSQPQALLWSVHLFHFVIHVGDARELAREWIAPTEAGGPLTALVLWWKKEKASCYEIMITMVMNCCLSDNL